MMKKTLIIGMLLTSLLIVSTFSVGAIEETKTIEDDEDDVVKSDFEEGTETIVSNKPNVDITKIKYERDDQDVTVTLTVKGKIENRGNIEDLLGSSDEDPDSSDFSLNFVMYGIELTTSSMFYSITYVNNVCNMSYSDGYMDPESCSATGSNLVVSFDLQDEDETFVSLSAITMDIKLLILIGNSYMDIAPDLIDLEVTASGSSKGKVNETISFSGDVDGGYPEYEWEWDFDDGVGISSLQNPTYKFDKPGTYEVTLYVSDENLNSGFDSFEITITDNNNNKINENQEESSFQALLMFFALIAIIAVAGIAVLVHMIRK